MPLSMFGLGIYLPPAQSVRDLVTARGGDLSEYKSWSNACIALADDHPSTMAARALQEALDGAKIRAMDLDIVLFAGVSRDYLPSWSVSEEVMRLCGASSRCLGLDVTAGCAALLASLELAHGWLSLRGSGYAAIIDAERWSYTADYANAANRNIWTHGDSAAALVVGLGTDKAPFGTYLGAEFSTKAANNGHVLLPYGGTRTPEAPVGVNAHLRVISDRPGKDIINSYKIGFAEAYTALKSRFNVEPSNLLCNQTTPNMVSVVAEALGMTPAHTIVTGEETGHLGGPDVLVGLRRLIGSGPITEPILVAASTAYAFGTGFLVPPSSLATG